jgi:2-polyprenyl-3-methyl-5-hydroxy-6-metoxy-1,4-benzoquinol methylase
LAISQKFEEDYWIFEEKIRRYNFESLREYYEEVLEDIAKEMKKLHNKHLLILDVGCGYGYFMQACAKKLYKCIGVDISKYALSKIMNRSHVILCDVQCGIPLKSKIVDVATMLDVIEHVDKIQIVLKEIKRVLKPHGLLYISTPNIAAIMRFIKGKNWYGFLDTTHVSLFTPIRLKSLLRDHNFHVVKCYTPFKFFLLPRVLNKFLGHLYIGGQIRLVAQA